MPAATPAPKSEPNRLEGVSVQLRGVRRTYPASRRGGAPVTALETLDLSVAPREVVGVVGPSGCGKSTLLELVAGLQDPDAGEVTVARAAGAGDKDARRGAGGRDRSAATDRLQSCSLMPQRDLLLPWRDALANAALALECAGIERNEARERARPLFDRFGLARFEEARPAELSGGMRQRVAFLRTLLAGRPALLLDEPFAALDSITRAEMQEWLQDALADDPRTVVSVTHDVEEALFLADRVVVLSARPGRVVAEIAVDIPRPRQRIETVSDPGFVALREQAMEALAG